MKMHGAAKRAYEDAYKVFRNKIQPVPERPMSAVQTWKELHSTYSRQFREVVPGLESTLNLLQDGEMMNHLDDTSLLIQKLEFLKEQTHAVLYAQLCALEKAWKDTYVTVAHEGEAVMMKDLTVGVSLVGTLDTIDNRVSDEILCVLESKEGRGHIGAPVIIGRTSGYFRQGGLSSTPDGRVCVFPEGKLELLYPKLAEQQIQDVICIFSVRKKYFRD